jgi:hypothetical protein
MRQSKLHRFWRKEPKEEFPAEQKEPDTPSLCPQQLESLPDMSLCFITQETIPEFKELNLRLFPVAYNPDFYRNVLINPHLSRLRTVTD